MATGDAMRSGAAPRGDLQVHLQSDGPGGELAGIGGIGPDQADPAADPVQVP